VLIEEAQWLGKQIRLIEPDKIYPMCNVGSSTRHFRTVIQPYIDKYLFSDTRSKGSNVIHVDIKADDGVDLVGDLTSDSFIKKLQNLNAKSVMLCNVLEHVVDRTLLCNTLSDVLQTGGYLFITVPKRFPYHEDPIDTMFRPSIGELISLFPSTYVHAAKVVRASSFDRELRSSKIALAKLIVRCCVPFYRPQHWLKAIKRLRGLIVGYTVTCAILKKA
jgi:hypothetical protein